MLGTIDMETAVAALLSTYSDTRDERPAASGEAVLATVTVDRDGRLIENEAVSVSSFGWGVPVALSGDLAKLREWPREERGLLEGLLQKLSRSDGEGNPIPLTQRVIVQAYEWLVQRVGLDAGYVRPPALALRAYQYYKFTDPPDALLLNSFFLSDLAQARELIDEGEGTHNLNRYLQVTKPKQRKNLIIDRIALNEALEPRHFPAGSWPAAGRHPLALLQQCAVNLALRDFRTRASWQLTARRERARRPFLGTSSRPS